MSGFYRAYAQLLAARTTAKVSALMRGSRTDRDLPLKLRIGGSILFNDPTKSILAAGAGHLVRFPASGVAKIVAWGSMRYLGRHTINRFYLDTGDAADDLILQVVVGSDGLVYNDEIRLLRLVREITPSSADEWTIWLPGAKGFREQQLRELGWTKVQIQAQLDQEYPDGQDRYLIGQSVFDVPDEHNPSAPLTRYYRIWPKEGAEFVEPIEFDESLHTDPWAQPISVTHRAMLYGRTLTAPQGSEGITFPDEWMWLQASEVGDEARVQLLAGLSLATTDFAVVPPSA